MVIEPSPGTVERVTATPIRLDAHDAATGHPLVGSRAPVAPGGTDSVFFLWHDFN